IWPKANAAILQGNMFMSGIGSIVAPLMVAPYVHGDDNVTAGNETITVEMRIRDLAIPFGVEGVLQSVGKFFNVFQIEHNTGCLKNNQNFFLKLFSSSTHLFPVILRPSIHSTTAISTKI